MINAIRSGTRRIPRSVWSITFLWGAMLFGASLVWPVATGLDETAHVNMAYEYAAHPFTFAGPGQLQYSIGVLRATQGVPGVAQGQRLATTPIPARSQRPSLTQLGGHQLATGMRPDQMVQHPPLYYWAGAVLLHFPGVSGLAWDQQIWLLRLLSAAFMLPIPILCWATAKRIMASAADDLAPGSASRYAVLAALVPLTVPNLIRDGASVQNDTLLILATSVVTYGLARVLTGDFGPRTAGLIGTAIAVALWTKGFALALPPIAAISYAVAARRSGQDRDELVTTLFKPLVIVVAGCLIGSIWWIRNLAAYHALQPNGWGAYYSVIRGTPDNRGTLSRFVPPFLNQFFGRIWGEVGIPDTPSPGPLVIYGWLALATLGIVGALLVKSRTGSRRTLAVLGLIPLSYFLIDTSGSYSTFRKWSLHGPVAVQGRYVYGGVVAAAVLITIGWHKLVESQLFSRLATITVIGALATNAAVWLLILRSWYAPADDHGLVSGTGAGVRSLLKWSPVPQPVTILLIMVVPALAGILAVLAVRREVEVPSAG